VRPIGYNIIGRQANVVAAKEMFTYLITTINRLLLEHNHNDPRQNMSKYSNSWKEGCADRLRERLTERHEQNLKEQAAEARERKARASHSASAPTSNALVVVMTDYAQDEADLNTDMRFGQKPGTTKADRLRAVALREAEKEEKRKRIEEARAAGASERVLIAMETFSYTREEAELFIDKVDNPPEDKRTEKQKARDEERERKRDERWSRQYWREQARQANRLDSRGYAAGQKAGDNIGLDKQVKSNPAKRID
jgi:hypothetical protein